MILYLLLLPLLCMGNPIRGMILIGEEGALLGGERLQEIEGVQIEKLDLPGSFSGLVEELKPLYLGKEWNEENTRAIRQQIYRHYQQNHRPFVTVAIPDQNQASGILQILVEESRLGKVEIVGNRWTQTKRLANYFHTQAGDPISLQQVSKDVRSMNRNPFRRVDVSYRPGTEVNTTDLTLEVNDRRQIKVYAGVDNTGVLTTGRERAFAGFSWNQVFGLDHIFSYQYITNFHSNRLQGHVFQYTALLPTEVLLNFYGGFSSVRTILHSPHRTNKGANLQGSIRCHIPFLSGLFFTQEALFGWDIKNTNNTVEFVDSIPTFGQTVNLAQGMFGYQAKWEKEQRLASLNADFLFSPGGWLPHQSDSDFASLRAGAKNHWIYARAAFHFQDGLPRSFLWKAYLRAQWSSQILLPSEQLGLGGYDSVRGYDERQLNADSALLGSLELHAPAFSLFRKQQDKMGFLLFADGGAADHNFLVGAGPGLRYAFGASLTARCDWGFKLHHQKAFTGNSSMIHFNLTGSF